jgi:anti-sigma-K factor RskA
MNEQPMTHDDAIDLAAGYVLGALEPAEEAAVHEHLVTCPEPHPEFAEFGGIVSALLVDVPLVEPPVALRDRIMEAARADLGSRRRPPVTAPSPTVLPSAFPSAIEREARRTARTSGLDWLLRIAAVIAIVAIGAWGLGVQRQLDAARQFDQAVANVLDAAGRPGAHAVILSPAQGKQGQGIAAVAPDGTVTLAMRDLPATNDGQVYTTWVIVGKNAPIAVADFTVDANGTAAVTSRPAQTPPGAILAVTLEPNRGNTAPQGPIISTGSTPSVTGATG